MTPDYSECLKAMIKEIIQLEKICYCKVVELSSVPHSAKLISCRRMFKLNYRYGAYERHRARLVAMGYQQEEKRDMTTSKAFLPPARILPFGLS